MSYASQNFVQNHHKLVSVMQRYCEPGQSSIQEINSVHSEIARALQLRDLQFGLPYLTPTRYKPKQESYGSHSSDKKTHQNL